MQPLQKKTLLDNDLLRLERVTVGPLDNNAYIVTCAGENKSVLIDAPGTGETLLSELINVNLLYILLTHGHGDHTGALIKLKESLDITVGVHEGDRTSLPLEPDLLLIDGDTLPLGKLKIRVIHTPGHTPGSISYRIASLLFSGDTIFPGGPGKTWSPEEFQQLLKSLKEKVFVLPGETRILPGHGPSTFLDREKESYRSFINRADTRGLYGDITWSK